MSFDIRGKGLCEHLPPDQYLNRGPLTRFSVGGRFRGSSLSLRGYRQARPCAEDRCFEALVSPSTNVHYTPRKVTHTQITPTIGTGCSGEVSRFVLLRKDWNRGCSHPHPQVSTGTWYTFWSRSPGLAHLGLTWTGSSKQKLAQLDSEQWSLVK